MKLSFCAIVKDEETTLPDCLNSVKDVVDEMVVLDTGSTDNTVAVAESLGAKVHRYQWNNDFAAARNESLKYVQGDWVLVLDADEQLVPAIAPKLKQAIETDDYIAINLLRQEVGAAQSPYSMVSRLFRHHPEIRFSRPYHALVDDSIDALRQRETHWKIGSLGEVAILHEGYRADAIARGNKLARAQAAMEAFLKDHPGDPYTCSKLGALYVQTGKCQKGVRLLSQGLSASAGDPGLTYELHYHLGIACSRLNNSEQAIIHYQTATQQAVLPRLKLGAYNNLGSLLKAKGNLLAAKQAYQEVMQIDSNFAIGHYNLGTTLKAMGDLPNAIAAYRRAIALNPDYAEAYQNLGLALLKAGQIQESLKALKRAIALHQRTNPIEAQRLHQGLKEMGFSV